VIAAVIGAQGNFAGFRFSGGAALGRVFDAVRDGIADEMDEWVGDLLNDVVVQLGFTAVRSSSTCLPADVAASRTARDKREYNVPMGTMRAAVNSS